MSIVELEKEIARRFPADEISVPYFHEQTGFFNYTRNDGWGAGEVRGENIVVITS